MPSQTEDNHPYDRHAGFDLHDSNLNERLESIYEKYERDFDGFADEIDILTGEILVDNGHIKQMADVDRTTDGWGPSLETPCEVDNGKPTMPERTLKRRRVDSQEIKTEKEQLTDPKPYQESSTKNPAVKRRCSGSSTEGLNAQAQTTLEDDTIVVTSPKLPTRLNRANNVKVKRRKKRGSRMRFTKRRK